MKSTIKKRGDVGFTLVEVLVALAIAGGSLILILSANAASLRKSVRARVAERLQRAAESKFAELKTGAERAGSGTLPGFPGHRWDLRTDREGLGSLRTLVRIRFRVSAPGEPPLELQELWARAPEGP
jgi:prepilin-type N-terminal cleavage/methylation domain-containing protein